jgi:[ribosomal protein S18]-alanine N-acetyltransferase
MLRELQEADMPRLSALHRLCFDRGWDEEEIRGVWKSGSRGWGIDSEDGLVAFLLCRMAADEAEIISLGVAPEERRKGHAKTLMDKAMRELWQRGISVMFLEVRENNAEGRALYRGLGFTESASRPNYYRMADGSYQHAVVMRKAIGKGQ